MVIGAAISVACASLGYGQEGCGPVGESSIHACLYRGEGPTIVLAAGAGQDSRTWDPLIEELIGVGRVVSFDRPGFGRSPNAEGPRTPSAIAHEIRDLLASLGVSGPLVLVGHSMGGVHLLRYADLFPESVVGVVLLDTPPKEFERERMGLLSPDERERRQADLAEGRSRAPDVVGRERDGAASEPWEFDRLPATVPLFVVIGDSQNFGELGSQEAHRELWSRLSERWLDLSSRSELVVARGSGHRIHREHPQLVVDLIRRLVAAVETRQHRRPPPFR